MPTVVTSGNYYGQYSAEPNSDFSADSIPFPLPGTTAQEWYPYFSGSFTGDATVVLHFDPSLLGSTPTSDLGIED